MAVREHGLFRKVEHPHPDSAQGGCYVYHTSGSGVDTGVDIYGEGTLYLSDLAIKELAEVAGFSVNTEAIKLEKDVEEFAMALMYMRVERDALRAQLDGIGLTLAAAYAVEVEPEMTKGVTKRTAQNGEHKPQVKK